MKLVGKVKYQCNISPDCCNKNSIKNCVITKIKAYCVKYVLMYSLRLVESFNHSMVGGF